MANRIRLGELLVRAGVIDEMQLKSALAEQHRWGGRLGRVLVDMAFVSEEILVKALSKQLGIERADLTRFDVPSAVVKLIPVEFAQEHSLCPVRYDEAKRSLVVAFADPTNVAALDELRFKTGLRIETVLAGENELRAAIQRHLRAAHGISFEMSAIDIDEDVGSDAGFFRNDDYASVMAASGVSVQPDRPGTGVPTPSTHSGAPMVVAGQAVDPPGPKAWSAGPPPASDGHFAPPRLPSAALSPVASGALAPGGGREGFAGVMPGAGAPHPQQVAGPAQSAVPHPAVHLDPGAARSAAPHPVAQGAPPPAPVSPEIPTNSAVDMAARREGAQQQQQRALSVMVELLIEKGVISRDDYLARVNLKR